MCFYQRIRDIREENDLSQQNVADILNITRQQYRLYESGIKSITVNGEAVEGDFVCECKMTEQTNITVVMG